MNLFKKRECPFCGEPLDYGNCCINCADELKDCLNSGFQSTNFCDGYTAPFFNKDKIKNAIYKTKFENNKSYMKVFVDFLILCDIPKVDFMVYVPRYNNNKKYRNINLSYELLVNLKSKLGLEVNFSALNKVKETVIQHNIGFKSRLINLKDSFSADENIVKNKSILIVDDMITTGATVDEISRECKNKGAKYVYAISIAISNYTNIKKEEYNRVFSKK